MARKQGRTPRKPHNARTGDYATFEELLSAIANEPRKATIAGKQVTITRAEALLRALVDRALQGNGREIVRLLKIMAKDPALAATSRFQTVIFISGALAEV